MGSRNQKDQTHGASMLLGCLRMDCKGTPSTTIVKKRNKNHAAASSMMRIGMRRLRGRFCSCPCACRKGVLLGFLKVSRARRSRRCLFVPAVTAVEKVPKRGGRRGRGQELHEELIAVALWGTSIASIAQMLNALTVKPVMTFVNRIQIETN